jgi:hypothetical protein
MSAAHAVLPRENAPFAVRPVKRRIPSPRNREVFRQVKGIGRSQDEVAAEFRLSQPRVTQICEQVRDWISQVTLGEELGLAPAEALLYAERLLEMRLEDQRQEVMAEYRRSKLDKVQLKERRDKAGELLWTEKTTSTQTGKVGCLSHTLRLCLSEARLAGVDVTGRTKRLAAKAEEENRLAQGRLKVVPADFDSSKPLSKMAGGEEESARPEAGVVGATAEPGISCNETTAPESPATISLADLQNSYSAVAPAIAPANQPLPPLQDLRESHVPRFLSKKDRKRLRALRRKNSRRELLSVP